LCIQNNFSPLVLTLLDGVGQDPTGQSLHCSTGTNAAHLQGFLAGNLHTKGTIELAYWGMRMHNEAFCFVTQVMNAHALSQMVWEQESTFIIMLTLITEGGKVCGTQLFEL